MTTARIYSYKCRSCGHTHDTTTHATGYMGPCPRPACDGDMYRDYSSVQLARPAMQEHLNTTTGTVVRTMSQFEDDLKRKSEEATLRTGIEHKFVPHMPSEAPGVTGEGIDESNRTRTKLGLPTLPEPR